MTTPWIVAFVALWMLVIVLGLLVLGTLRRLAPLIERAEESLSAAAAGMSPGGLPIGSTVPAFSVEEVGGSTFTHGHLEGSRTIVLFLSSSCRACERFVDDLENGRIPNLGVQLVVVSDDADQALTFSRASSVTMLVQKDRSLSRVFESDATPQAFVVDEARRVLASGTPNDWERLRRLLAEAERGGGRELDVAAAAIAS